MVPTTRYSVIFQKFPSRVRVEQKITSSIRVAGTRWGLVSDKVTYWAVDWTAKQDGSEYEYEYELPTMVGIELPGQQQNWYNFPNLAASSSTEIVFVPSHKARLTLTYIS